MLTATQLRQVAGRSGARDIGNVEIDVILTYVLQLFAEKSITGHVAFKGGTMLRKMVFGPRGRLSTDLDFTCCTDISVDDLMLMMLEAVEHPYHGISFRFDRDKDWYLTDEVCAANPVCAHLDNENGVKIKLQVSMRERPILPIHPMPQLALGHFKCWNSLRLRFPVWPSRKWWQRKSGLPACAPKSETFMIFLKSRSGLLIATSFALWRYSNCGAARVRISTMIGSGGGSWVRAITTLPNSPHFFARTRDLFLTR